MRLAALVVLVAAMAAASGAARSTSRPSPDYPACTASALGEAFTGALRLRSLDNFGCVGTYAFAWATVGSTPHEIGVTEVLRFSSTAQRWAFVSRLAYCKPGDLPERIYRLGCFSN